MTDIIKKTVEKLKNEKTKPFSGWVFILKKSFKWVAAFAVGLLAGISLVTIIFLIFQFDWTVRSEFGGPFSLGMRFLPFFWIFIGGILVFGTYYAVRHTKFGYKYDWKKILVIVAGLIFGAGVFAYVADLGRKTDFVARENFPSYARMVPEMRDQWMNPQEGFLAGEIISSKEDEIEIMDFDGNKWKILLDEKTIVMPMAEISKGEGIKIIGEKISSGEFRAEEIRPWMGNRMQRKFDQGEFRGGYRHMTRPEVKGEFRKGTGDGRGIMNERWN